MSRKTSSGTEWEEIGGDVKVFEEDSEEFLLFLSFKQLILEARQTQPIECFVTEVATTLAAVPLRSLLFFFNVHLAMADRLKKLSN